MGPLCLWQCFTNKTQISNVFIIGYAGLKLKQNNFHTFHKGTDSLWASAIFGPPRPLGFLWPFGPPGLGIPGPLGLHVLSGHMGLLGLLNVEGLLESLQH